jgi:hypothetical protein
MKVEVITTENEELKETGFGTLKSCRSVLEAVKGAGHEARVSVWRTKRSLDAILKRKPDLVILGVKYILLKNSDDIWLADYFDLNVIDYSGSSRETLRFDSEELNKINKDGTKNRIKDLAVNAFISLGVRDFGRIDIKTNKSGRCFFMEANLVPGMTSGSSYFPEACEIENDLNYDDVVGLLVSKGLSRVSDNKLLISEGYLCN